MEGKEVIYEILDLLLNFGLNVKMLFKKVSFQKLTILELPSISIFSHEDRKYNIDHTLLLMKM